MMSPIFKNHVSKASLLMGTLISTLVQSGSAFAEIADAESAGHGGGDFNLSALFHQTEFWGSVVNFILLIALFYFGARKPVKSFLLKRREVLESEINAAKEMKEKAEAQYKELSARLESFDSEAKSLKERIVKSGESERDQIIQDAKEKAVRIEQDATFAMGQKIKQLRTELKKEIVEEAFETALSEIKNSLEAKDQEILANRFLEKMKAEVSSSVKRA